VKQSVKENARMVEGPVENFMQMTSARVDGWTKYTDKQGVYWENKACNYGEILLSQRWKKHQYILIFNVPARACLHRKRVHARGCVPVRYFGTVCVFLS
jgi:hypothetical protein